MRFRGYLREANAEFVDTSDEGSSSFDRLWERSGNVNCLGVLIPFWVSSGSHRGSLSHTGYRNDFE